MDKKQEIYNSGKELFSEKGFKDTNVADITKNAGMATGTFYNYYTSKDQLFMEIFLNENAKLKRSIVEKTDLSGEPLGVMRHLMSLNYIEMNEDPILKEWYNRDAFNKIEGKFREEKGAERVDFMYYIFIDLVRKWQAEGKMRNDIDAEMIMAIFSAIVNIDTHKEEIGVRFFPELMDHVSEFIMKGLTDIKNVKR